jgi:alpha-D-ribose 1-methylphosphonate 5-triphosphate synthase subunit PhnL
MTSQTPPVSSPLLKVENLAKSFRLHARGGIEVEGFSGINFNLERGRLLALIGPSGSGKSSVLKTIYRTYLPTDGRILFIAGGCLTDLAACSETEILQLRKSRIGFVTQFLKVLPRISAIDSVAGPLIDMGEEQESARRRAGELLSFLGIREQLFGISPLTFSGGEQQRVNIARGIIAPKELLLLDEPTASLDPQAASQVVELLQQLKRRKTAMIAVFHDLAKVQQVADQVYNLAKATGVPKPEDLRGRHENLSHYNAIPSANRFVTEPAKETDQW